MEWEWLGHIRAVEQGWRRVRAAAGAVGALWVLIASPEAAPRLRMSSVAVALGILAAVAAIDLAARRVARRRDREGERRAELVVVTGDGLLCLALLAVFAGEPGSAVWALLAVPVVEGALLWGVAGAGRTWTACALAYLALAAVPGIGPSGLRASNAVARLAVTLLIGLVAGTVGETLLGQRQVLERVRSELAHRATHDPLTGAPNRTLFADRLRQALARSPRYGGTVAVLFVDCDDFKAVNDRHGHAVGDRVLVQLAARMAEAVRPGDTVGRRGGDEFVVLLEGLDSAGEAVAVAQRLLERVATPIRVDTHDVVVSVTVGIALAPGPQIAGEDLIAAADRAMYRAKAAGGRSWEVAGDV